MELRRKKPDKFQMELNEALKKRREFDKTTPMIKEESESEIYTEDEMYQYGSDSFSEESVEATPAKKQSSSFMRKTMLDDEWNVPSYLKDSSDPLDGGGSLFLKDNKPKNTLKTNTFDPLGMGSKSIQEDTGSSDYDDDPIMKLLRGSSPEQTPKPKSRAKESLRKSPEHEPLNKSHKEKRGNDTSPSRPKTPVSGKQNAELKGILDSLKTKQSSDILSTEPRTKNKQAPKAGSQDFVDFLLDPSQPKPAPRKKSSQRLSVDSKSSKSPSRSLSPASYHEDKKKTSDLKKQRSLSGDREVKEALEAINRPVSPRSDGKSFTSLGLPTLKPGGSSLTAPIEDTSVPKLSKSPPLQRTEKEQSKADGDDLLALFNQAVASDNANIQDPIKPKEEKQRPKTPLEVVMQKTAQEAELERVKQRPSRQLIDNVIDNVAQHNDGSDVSSMSSHSATKTKTPRPRSGRKSYRTPPANYQGLGSLTMLKELKEQKKGNETERNETGNNVSSDDIRKKIYLDWLAKREEELKKKRKEKAVKEKEEKEKLQKEREEKEIENALVRKKWDEVKTEQSKEKAKARQKKEMQKEKIQAEKEKQKVKSEKDAEKRRQQMLETARIQHRAEIRKKQDEERQKKKKERKHKEENKKALEKWMDTRSEKWVDDRKKEDKEKRKQQKEVRKEKQDAAKEAEEKYNTWREKKDNQLKKSMRENRLNERRLQFDIYEDEENTRPPWSPPNKVIPRKR